MRALVIASILALSTASVAAPAAIDVKQLDRDRVVAAANEYLKEEPITVTIHRLDELLVRRRTSLARHDVPPC